MHTIPLDLVRQKLAAKLGSFDGWEAEHDDGEVSLHGPGPWSPHPYDADAMADIIVEGILDRAWSSHCQYLAVLFGEERTGC
jgi:superoxide dismutase